MFCFQEVVQKMKERNFALKTKDAWDWQSICAPIWLQYYSASPSLNLSWKMFKISLFVFCLHWFLVCLYKLWYHWYLQLWNTFFLHLKRSFLYWNQDIQLSDKSSMHSSPGGLVAQVLAGWKKSRPEKQMVAKKCYPGGKVGGSPQRPACQVCQRGTWGSGDLGLGFGFVCFRA